MSRAYRIRVRESLRRVVRAKDHVRTQIELLGILPRASMAELLAEELAKRGFERRQGKSVRRQGSITVSVDDDGNVTIAAEAAKDVEVSDERQGLVYDDVGPSREEKTNELRKELVANLEKQTGDRQKELQERLAEELEGVLGDVRGELDRAVSAATGQALKLKAAQIGEIQEITEDSETGSLTIVIEV